MQQAQTLLEPYASQKHVVSIAFIVKLLNVGLAYLELKYTQIHSLTRKTQLLQHNKHRLLFARCDAS